MRERGREVYTYTDTNIYVYTQTNTKRKFFLNCIYTTVYWGHGCC